VAKLVIRQFAVFTNPSARTRAEVPYIVVLQSHFVSAFDTVVVAPLMRRLDSQADDQLLLRMEFEGEPLTQNVALLANIPGRGLRSSIGSLGDEEDRIRRALERLFTGF